MTIVELLVAILILTIGILGTFVVFTASKKGTHVSEGLESQTHVAQRELERIESLPYVQIGLTTPPAPSTDRLNPNYYVSAGTCPSFTWNQSPGATSGTAPLVINGCASFSGGTVPRNGPTTYSGYTVYDFVTWVSDPSGGTTSTAYKRVTVEVTANQVASLTPTRPVLVSAIVADPHAAPAAQQQLNSNSPLVTCDPLVPSSTPCNYGLDGQTPNVFYLTDSPEQNGVQTVGNTTNGSNAITGVGTTTGVQAGMSIAGPGISPNTTVQSVSTSTSQLTISQNATATATAARLAIGPTSGAQTTGTTAIGSNVITAMGTTTGVAAGMYISGSGIPSGTTVTSVDSGSQIHISLNATANASATAISIWPYSPRAADNTCMHYTNQLRPLASSGSVTCGGTSSSFSCSTAASATATPNACARPDLLFPAPAPTSVAQEYNFSPNLSATTQGRVIKRDSNTSTTSCSVAPTNDASSGELWATQPLAQPLKLTGFGGMSLYTSTLTGASQPVTLCVSFYLETPVATAIGAILDPLNSLGASDSTPLGTISYTLSQWPPTITPLSFTFNYMTSSQTVPAGTSVAMRVWVTHNSGDDIVIQYDAPSAPSDVLLNSQS